MNAPLTAALFFPPDDPEAAPDRRLTVMAEQLAGMANAGELNALADDTRRAFADMQMVLLDIAGAVRLPRRGGR